MSQEAEWEKVVKKPQEICVTCEEALRSGEEVLTSLSFGAEGFARQDQHPGCVAPEHDAVATWRWTRASELRPNPRRLDLGFLSEFFKRLDGRDEEHSRRVRWIVALLLLRKKILEEVGRRQGADTGEVLQFRFKKTERVYDVADPGLDSEAMASIEDDLSRIFNLEQGAEKDAAPDQVEDRSSA